MKKFFWSTVKKHELADTVWENVDFTDVDYLEPIELEKLFGAKKKSEVKSNKDKAAVPENPYENMIDLKRANNIGIMLKHFKMAPSAIKKALLVQLAKLAAIFNRSHAYCVDFVPLLDEITSSHIGVACVIPFSAK